MLSHLGFRHPTRDRVDCDTPRSEFVREHQGELLSGRLAPQIGTEPWQADTGRPSRDVNNPAAVG